MSFREDVREALEDYFGEECGEYDVNCKICRTWRSYAEYFR